MLAPRLEPAQAQRAWDAVIANGTNRFIWDSQPKFVLPDVLEALAPRLEPTQLNHSGDAVFAMLLKPTDSNVLIAAQSGLGVLTHRLEPAQVERAADDVLSMLEQSTDSNVLIAASSLLAVLAPRIDPPQAKRAGDALIAILEKSTNTDLLYEAYRGLEARTAAAINAVKACRGRPDRDPQEIDRLLGCALGRAGVCRHWHRGSNRAAHACLERPDRGSGEFGTRGGPERSGVGRTRRARPAIGAGSAGQALNDCHDSRS